MDLVTIGEAYPSAKELVDNHVANRIRAKDATLYSFSEEAQACAQANMDWATLASKPPVPLSEITALAQVFIDRGVKDALLIGQGGSAQAPMTLTKYNKPDATGVRFHALDSNSPVRLREALAEADPKTTVIIVSSKSGDTLETRSMLSAVREAFLGVMPEDEFRSHLVAITDPGSPLALRASEEGWEGLLLGEPAVGDRFSALSVFGLFPAALVGIDLARAMETACEVEELCGEDAEDNPAVQLASFMYDNQLANRGKLAFVTQKRGRVLGLWVEQLVAGSTGKQGSGILPQIEIDPLLLRKDMGDRAVVTYHTKVDVWDELSDFDVAVDCINGGIPRADFAIEDAEELLAHFVIWEYAVAMCGYLMKVCPFDQPDAASTKVKALEILGEGLPDPDFTEDMVVGTREGKIEARLSDCCADAASVHDALRSLLGSLRLGDFFSINAFLPFTGDGRREALESIRHGVASTFKVMSCIEIGPRYLHSAGQLQKDGVDKGVYLIVSAGELRDIPLHNQEAESLGQLSKAQAIADQLVLAERGRRCLHLHLPDNTGASLNRFACLFLQVVSELRTGKW